MSVYASASGVGDYGDDGRLGQPWVYQGSHILPAATDPRGGSVGLAIIPSHITRDGRDDQPEDGRPWPWLRLSLAATTADPTVLLDPAQARHHAAQLTAWADEADSQPAPAGLRERYASAIHRYDHEHCLSRNDIPSKHHLGEADAVLAVRDAEMERLRRDLETANQLRAEVQRDRDQHAAVLREVMARFHPVRDNMTGKIIGYDGPTIDLDEHGRWRTVVAPTVERPWWEQVREAEATLARVRAALDGAAQ